MRKINIVNDISWPHHRSGWSYVVSLLSKFDCQEGVLVDGSLDDTFGSKLNNNVKSGIIPYKKNWVGFLHQPVNICPWYNQEDLSPAYVLSTLQFNESLRYCKAIFTFSDHLAKYVREKISTPTLVKNFHHPTETPRITFNYEKFLSEKKIISIGTWMRRLTTFFCLTADDYIKYLPTTKMTIHYLKREMNYLNNVNYDEIKRVNVLERVDNRTYDLLLSESVVFLDLYDSSANNAIIECIVRNTPLLVNRIPAVEEYLGKDYPLFYHDLSQAEQLLLDMDKIKLAHQYLKENINKDLFKGKYFVKSFFNSLAKLT